MFFSIALLIVIVFIAFKAALFGSLKETARSDYEGKEDY
jgi:hypothetical protein